MRFPCAWPGTNRVFDATAAVLILLFLSGAAHAQEKPALKTGDPAPTFVLKDINGTEVFLRDYCGDLRQPWKNQTRHLVILSFFATWCQPCMKEIPQLQEISKEFRRQNLKIFLINLKEDLAPVRKFCYEKKIHLPVLLDKYGVVAGKYQVTSLPRLFVINREGKIIWYTTGYQEDFAEALRKVLERQFER